MAFRQYTRCVQPAKFVSFSRLARILLAGLSAAVAAVVVTLLLDEPWGILIALEIGGLATLIAYCYIWLYNRLICIDSGEVDVIGVVASVSPPSRRLGDLDWDNDYTFNLLLENTSFGATHAAAVQSQPYGKLVAPHPTLLAIGRQTPGHAARHGQTLTYGLHVEFEGRGNRTLLDAAVVCLVIAVAALLLSPVSGTAAVVLGVGSLLIMLLAFIIGKYVGAGSPSHVDPNLGQLNPIQLDANNNPLPGADVVYVKGTWVYDPLHEGWNEIHPIRVCVKVGTWTGSWATQPPINIQQLRAQHP